MAKHTDDAELNKWERPICGSDIPETPVPEISGTVAPTGKEVREGARLWNRFTPQPCPMGILIFEHCCSLAGDEPSLLTVAND